MAASAPLFPLRQTIAWAVLVVAAVIVRFIAGLIGEPRLLGAAEGLALLALLAGVATLLLWRRRPVQRLEARLARWLRPPRQLSFTREGRYFVAITFCVGFAAVNTGNNLLYLVLGMLLSMIVASGILSEMSLRDLEVARRPPSRVHAGTPFLMGIALRNAKRRLPSFSIEVEDLVDGTPLDKRCYFLKLPPGRKQQTSYRHTAPRRGRYLFTGFRLATRFPFALFRKSRLVSDGCEVIVLPALRPVSALSPPLLSALGDQASQRRGRRGEFHGLREYRPGDDPRDVHWRSSARRGRPMIREHEDETARRLTLLLDNALPGGAACSDLALSDGLERAVSLAASLVADYLGRGYSVRVVARGALFAWATSPTHLGRVLRELALLPTVEETVALVAPGEPTAVTLHVGRRGGPPPLRVPSLRLEA